RAPAASPLLLGESQDKRAAQMGGAGQPSRPAYFVSALSDTPVLRRETLAVGGERAGPLLIEEDASTTVVPPGWRVTVRPRGDLRMTREPGLSDGDYNDEAIETPIYRTSRATAWVGNGCHTAGVGGRVLSADARQGYEEGNWIPIGRACVGGQPNRELLRFV